MEVRIFPKVVDTRGIVGQSFALDLDDTGAGNLLGDAVIILSCIHTDTPILIMPSLDPGMRETTVDRPRSVRLSPADAADRAVRVLAPAIRELAKY